jgi:hypothetical protein
MAPIFKGGGELMDQALDLARRRDFARARQKFIDAGTKFTKEGSVQFASLANAYAELMRIGQGNTDPGTLTNLASFLRSSVGSTALRPGLREISSGDLANELELSARETSLVLAVQSGGGDRNGLAQALQGLANDYRRLGNQPLFLPEFLQQRAIPADSRVPVLMALSYETLGAATQIVNPLQAAEHFQTAQQYWVQAGDDAKAREVAALVSNLALRAKCWFCGREGAGHGVQFVSMPIDQDVTGLKGLDSSPLPSLDQSGSRVFVCKGCFSAVRLLATRIAEERVAQVREELLAEIRRLEQRISSVRPSR